MCKNRVKNWSRQLLFVGIDLHKNKWVVTVRTEAVTLKTFVTSPDKHELLKALRRQWPGAMMRAVYEAGCFGYHLAEFLCDNGIETIIVAPHTVPVKRGNFVKTDKIDSQKLALELSKGCLVGIYRPTREALQERSLARKRAQMMKRRIQIQSQLKSDLLFYGIKVRTTRSGHWSKEYVEQLKNLNIEDERYRKVFHMMIEEYEGLKKQVQAVTRLIVQLSGTDRYRKKVSILKTVPGISTLTAMILLLEIGDFGRFKSGNKFVSYLGLTPSEHSSGNFVRKGRLTGMGNGTLRCLMIEAAWVAIRKDPALLEKFNRIRVGKLKTTAIVAVAKSLAMRVRRILQYEEPYVIGVVS